MAQTFHLLGNIKNISYYYYYYY